MPLKALHIFRTYRETIYHYRSKHANGSELRTGECIQRNTVSAQHKQPKTVPEPLIVNQTWQP